MLDVPFSDSGNQKDGFVRANQLLGQLLPRRHLLVPCVDLPELRQSPDRAVQLDPPLYL